MNNSINCPRAEDQDAPLPVSRDTTPPAQPAQPVKAEPQFLTDPLGWCIRHSFLARWFGRDV